MSSEFHILKQNLISYEEHPTPLYYLFFFYLNNWLASYYLPISTKTKMKQAKNTLWDAQRKGRRSQDGRLHHPVPSDKSVEQVGGAAHGVVRERAPAWAPHRRVPQPRHCSTARAAAAAADATAAAGRAQGLAQGRAGARARALVRAGPGFWGKRSGGHGPEFSLAP